MVTITWHLLILLLLVVFGFVWVVTRDKQSGMFGSPRAWAILLWATATVVILLIYGGFFWW